MKINDWKTLRWNEALELFNQLVNIIEDEEQLEFLNDTTPIVSQRLADASIYFPSTFVSN